MATTHKRQTFKRSQLFQIFTVAHIESIETSPLFISIGLGFALSLLFVMDQNISAAMVDTPAHKLRKGLWSSTTS